MSFNITKGFLKNPTALIANCCVLTFNILTCGVVELIKYYFLTLFLIVKSFKIKSCDYGFCIENQDSKASDGHVTRANRANTLKSPLKSTEIN